MVRTTGSRSWVLRAQVDGKRQDFGLGSTTVVSLAEARLNAAEMRAKLKRREEIRPGVPEAEPATPTFADAARNCHKALKSGWRNRRHSDSWLASLENHIFPHIGTVRVDEVTSARTQRHPPEETPPHLPAATQGCFRGRLRRLAPLRLRLPAAIAHVPHESFQMTHYLTLAESCFLTLVGNPTLICDNGVDVTDVVHISDRTGDAY